MTTKIILIWQISMLLCAVRAGAIHLLPVYNKIKASKKIQKFNPTWIFQLVIIWKQVVENMLVHTRDKEVWSRILQDNEVKLQARVRTTACDQSLCWARRAVPLSLPLTAAQRRSTKVRSSLELPRSNGVEAQRKPTGAHKRPLVRSTDHTLLFLARSELIQFSA